MADDADFAAELVERERVAILARHRQMMAREAEPGRQASRKDVLLAAGIRHCRVCLCTDARACPGGCSWVDMDLCSRCAGGAGLACEAAAAAA
ncbi:MAG: hypothetical protein K2X74_17615 [Acetobacteraceae bacterium]|nr:hypothetical protein [Acetobacteraceae bacterium]